MSNRLEDYDDEICPECGIGFEAKSVTQKYCSLECGEKHRNEFSLKCLREETRARQLGLLCAHCGATFDGAVASQLYCSKKCCANAQYHRNKKPKILPLLEKVCPGCTNSFSTKITWKVYCSTKCQRKARNLPKLKTDCGHCRKTFIARDHNHKFCSSNCRQREKYNQTVKKIRQDRLQKLRCSACNNPIPDAKCSNARYCKPCAEIEMRRYKREYARKWRKKKQSFLADKY